MLAAIATRRAVRELIDDLSISSATRVEAEYVREAVTSITRKIGPEGSAEELLDQLSARPFCIRGSTLIDPPALSDEIRTKCKSVELDMAEPVLSSTLEEHSELYCTFLDNCYLP